MVKRYNLSVNRHLVVNKRDGDLFITIAEEGADNKTVTFPSKRWAQLVILFNQIEEALHQLIARQYVLFKQHIGGGCYVSITTGFQCIDLRYFYFNHITGEPKPTKKGIALQISEWYMLKDLIPQINKNHPTLASAQPCYLQEDHLNQEGALSCTECFPFQYENLFRSLTG
jgi:hypothetical protein